jgi:tripartite-type tricarboxylate transporter receptor subunit TctC
MEAGYPTWEVTNWHGILGPKGLPREVIERLSRDLNEVLKSDELKKLLATDGLEPAGGSPADFAASSGARSRAGRSSPRRRR